MRKSGSKVLWIALLGLAVVGAVITGVNVSRAKAEERASLGCLKQSTAAFAPIYNALEAYGRVEVQDSISNVAVYPAKFQDVVSQGYLKQLPANPFGSGALVELQPGEPDRIGGFRYIPVYATYHLNTDETVEEPFHYIFVLYTPVWPEHYDELPYASRLGKGPFYMIPKEHPVTPHEDLKNAKARARQALVDGDKFDTDDEALKRAGY